MEELTQKIDELIRAINANSIPKWISFVGIFVPILLSVLVIIITIYQHRKNKRLQILINDKNEELQRTISEKEARVQMHGDILNIYDGYCLAQNTLGKAGLDVATVFMNPNMQFMWLNELQNSMGIICQVYNRAELIFPKSDTEIRIVLKSILEKYRELIGDIFTYINSGAADINRSQTWIKISSSYPTILPNDYVSLYYNKIATEDFIKLYSNEDTKKLDGKIKELMDLFSSEKFDKYFEPYVRLNTEKEDN